MVRPRIALACLAALAAGGVAAQAPGPSREIAAAVASPARAPANRERDRYRHPAETLSFFGVKPNQTVVEFLPGGGWYTEILAPMVKAGGAYIALVPPQQAEELRTALTEKAAQYGATQIQTVDFKTGASTIPAGTADIVLTFRNVHNLLMQADPAVAARVFKAFHDALKPGGVLGVVDHRLPEQMDTARENRAVTSSDRL